MKKKNKEKYDGKATCCRLRARTFIIASCLTFVNSKFVFIVMILIEKWDTVVKVIKFAYLAFRSTQFYKKKCIAFYEICFTFANPKRKSLTVHVFLCTSGHILSTVSCYEWVRTISVTNIVVWYFSVCLQVKLTRSNSLAALWIDIWALCTALHAHSWCVYDHQTALLLEAPKKRASTGLF